MDFYKKIFEKSNKANKSKKSEKETSITKNEKNRPKIKTKDDLIKNLAMLKEIVTQPKEENPTTRSKILKDYLKEEESFETMKIERWYPTAYCPECKSTKIKKLSDNINKPDKYKCLKCSKEFSDDSDSPLEGSSIPLHTWMECWYLLGITDSIEFIASKLKLDISSVIWMIRILQRLFRVQQPLTKYMSYDDWYNESSFLKEKIKEQIIDKHDQLLGKVAIEQARDTREEARQKERRLEFTKKKPKTF